MGANSCYSLAFAVPSVVFGVALIIFIAGKKKYRIVPAAGGFLPWTAVKACTTSFFQWKMASKSERREKGGILNFGVASYGKNINMIAFYRLKKNVLIGLTISLL